MSEKYDGVRGCWNPVKKKLNHSTHFFLYYFNVLRFFLTSIRYSRTGVELTCPDSFIESLPDNTFLDGEIWYLFCTVLIITII